jgi:hypothetical protein
VQASSKIKRYVVEEGDSTLPLFKEDRVNVYYFFKESFDTSIDCHAIINLFLCRPFLPSISLSESSLGQGCFIVEEHHGASQSLMLRPTIDVKWASGVIPKAQADRMAASKSMSWCPCVQGVFPPVCRF